MSPLGFPWENASSTSTAVEFNCASPSAYCHLLSSHLCGLSSPRSRGCLSTVRGHRHRLLGFRLGLQGGEKPTGFGHIRLPGLAQGLHLIRGQRVEAVHVRRAPRPPINSRAGSARHTFSNVSLRNIKRHGGSPPFVAVTRKRVGSSDVRLETGISVKVMFTGNFL